MRGHVGTVLLACMILQLGVVTMGARLHADAICSVECDSGSPPNLQCDSSGEDCGCGADSGAGCQSFCTTSSDDKNCGI
jgi:hypothetical protein